MNTQEISEQMEEDYPLLWEQCLQYDFAEKLGGCSDPLMREIDEVMREVWMARFEKTMCVPYERTEDV